MGYPDQNSYSDLWRDAMSKMAVRVTELEAFLRQKAFELPATPAPPPGPVPGGPFRLSWPAPDPKVTTQAFGINPQIYGAFGLKGHEGIDIRAVTGAQIVAAAEGIISPGPAVGAGGAYGIHVRINPDHPDGEFE